MKPLLATEGAALLELRRRLREEMAAHDGAISFARFMARALYEPGLGYYERDRGVVGKAGDFYTSVSVGPLFGELLACQFATWLESLPDFQNPAARFQLVEAGAHDGTLARDLLTALAQQRPELGARIDYRIIEPSPIRQAWQRTTLAAWGTQVHWCAAVAEVGEIRGVILSNELLDALPVHRLGWDAVQRRWFEWGVEPSGEQFGWVRGALVTPGVPLPELPAELLAVLPDGFTTEVCPAATDWWRRAAAQLTAGWLFTADYGLEAAEFFLPHRTNGTVRAYSGHRLVADVLADPGAQDLTAHVNFTALQEAGVAAGLATVARRSQRRFLTDVFTVTQGAGSGFPTWDAPRVRQFQTLTHPEHLGRAFSVLAQRRGGPALQ
jgi:SAM-dependent MidA family methyltransferase